MASPSCGGYRIRMDNGCEPRDYSETNYLRRRVICHCRRRRNHIDFVRWHDLGFPFVWHQRSSFRGNMQKLLTQKLLILNRSHLRRSPLQPTSTPGLYGTHGIPPNRRRPQPQARGYQVHRRRPEGAAGQLNSLSTGRQPEAGCACGTRSLGGVANKANNPANAAEPVNTMMGNR